MDLKSTFLNVSQRADSNEGYDKVDNKNILYYDRSTEYVLHVYCRIFGAERWGGDKCASDPQLLYRRTKITS